MFLLESVTIHFLVSPLHLLLFAPASVMLPCLQLVASIVFCFFQVGRVKCFGSPNPK